MRILVAGWVGSTNLGDELVFSALAGRLRARGVEIAAISADPAGTRAAHGVEAVGHLDLAGITRAVGDADAVLLGGGGLLQDVTSPWNLPLHLSRPWLAALRGTPWAGIGLGAGPLDGPLGRALARRTLRRAVAVSVRDAGSAAVLAGLGLARPLVAADLALSLPEPAVPPDDVLTVCLRPWSGRRSLLPVQARRGTHDTPDWFVSGAAAALDRAASATGLGVRFVALQPDRDDALHRRVAERMSTAAATCTPSLSEVVPEVCRGRVVVAMRYHGAIAAVLGARPAVLIGYAAKGPALASDLGEAAVGVGWSPDGLHRIPAAVAAAGGGDAMAGARDRLRARERANEAVLDALIEHGSRA